MSKASIGAKVGTLIVGAIKGKKSAAATATAYAKTKASKAAVKSIPKTKLAEPSKASVKVKPGRRATGPGLETRGNKITTESQKSAAKKLIKDSQNATMNSTSMNYYDSTFRGPSLKTLKRNAPVPRAADKKTPIKINSAPKRNGK